MKQDSRQRLMEVMQRLDKTFKPRLNEEFGGNTDDPTKEEMVDFLTNKFQGLVDPMETDANAFDIAAAIYWFANDYHGGQSSNLYSALSTSDYRPGPMHKSIEDDESETATMMYQELVNQYGGQADPIDAGNTQWHGIEMNEKDDKWIQKAVDPEHKGYCTPMTKDTCTPRRKALAKRFKKGIEDEGVQEDLQYSTPEEDTVEYKGKVEKLKQTMDKLFNEEYYDVIDTLFRLLVSREKGAGQIPSLHENADASSVGHNIYNDVMALINYQTGDEVWSGGAEGALNFYEKVLEGLRDAMYQDLGDSINKNAGAAPDEMVEGDAFNDAGEPMMSHQQFRDYSEPAEPEYDDNERPVQNKGMGIFTDIDWKVVYETILQNSQNPDSRDNATVNDLTDYDGLLSPEELNALKFGDVGVWYDNGGDYPFFDVADGDPLPTYEEFIAKAKDVFEHPEKIDMGGGSNDSEAPYMRGYEPMSENVIKKRLFEMMHKINPNSKKI